MPINSENSKNHDTSECQARRPWTTSELAIVRRYQSEGAEVVYEMLRDRDGNPTRSIDAIKCKASEIGVSLATRPTETCPVCGTHPIREGTAAARHGMCVPCWTRHLADLKREQVAVEAAQREYDAYKKRLKRLRSGGGR